MEIRKCLYIACLVFLFGCSSTKIVGDSGAQMSSSTAEQKQLSESQEDSKVLLRGVMEHISKCAELVTALYIASNIYNQSLEDAIAESKAMCGLKGSNEAFQIINRNVVEKSTTIVYESLTKLEIVDGEIYSFEMCLEASYIDARIEGMEELCDINQSLSKKLKEQLYKADFCKAPLIAELQAKIRAISRSRLEGDMKKKGKQEVCVSYSDMNSYLSKY